MIGLANRRGILAGKFPVTSSIFWNELDQMVHEEYRRTSHEGVQQLSADAVELFTSIRRWKTGVTTDSNAWPWQDVVVAYYWRGAPLALRVKQDKLKARGLEVDTYPCPRPQSSMETLQVVDVDVLLPDADSWLKERPMQSLFDNPRQLLSSVLTSRRHCAPTQAPKFDYDDYNLLSVNEVLTHGYAAVASGWHYVHVHSTPLAYQADPRASYFREHAIGQQINSLQELQYWAPEPLPSPHDLGRIFASMRSGKPMSDTQKWIPKKIDSQLG